MKLINSRNQFEREKRYAPFYINSCGYYSELTVNTGVTREKGREDFQLIYVTNGILYVQWGEETMALPKGSLILYMPEVPQKYWCEPGDLTDYFWIHFAGTEAMNILREVGFGKTGVYQVPHCPDVIGIMYKIFTEIGQKQSAYQIRLMALFCELLCHMKRHTSAQNGGMEALLRPALTEMEQNMRMDVSVLYYAKLCNMSVSYFMHSFKQVCGISPIAYRDERVMQFAAELLKQMDISVKGVANMVGARDPLYFSKKFKKYYGISPREYGRSSHNED